MQGWFYCGEGMAPGIFWQGLTLPIQRLKCGVKGSKYAKHFRKGTVFHLSKSGAIVLSPLPCATPTEDV